MTAVAPRSPDDPPPPVAPSEDGIVISTMRRRHLRAVVAIERASSPHPWSMSLFASDLSMPTSRHWVIARRSARVVGFAGLMHTLDEGHITNIAVHAAQRRQGVATRMLLAQFRAAIERGVSDMSLEVRVSNHAAQAMYHSFGFAPGGVRPGYYRDNGEDALILWAHGIGDDAGLDRLAAIEAGLAHRLRWEP
jgi:ribosomal-protein-alanine N-acetyltransferase